MIVDKIKDDIIQIQPLYLHFFTNILYYFLKISEKKIAICNIDNKIKDGIIQIQRAIQYLYFFIIGHSITIFNLYMKN